MLQIYNEMTKMRFIFSKNITNNGGHMVIRSLSINSSVSNKKTILQNLEEMFLNFHRHIDMSVGSYI